MPHIMTKPEFINQYLNGFRIRSIQDLNLWVTRKTLSETAAFDSVVDEAMTKIQNSYQALGESQQILFGRKLHNYSGFTKNQIMELFQLTSEQADEVIDALGVTGA